MAGELSFQDLMGRVRAGDEAAAAELVRRYEPAIRMEVRMRMRDRRLNRLFDSMDVCQSVLGSFFVRAALGQYDLEQPGDLVRLLVTMARNKLASEARKHLNPRRDVRRQAGDCGAAAGVAAADPSPSRVAAARELLDRFRQHLTEEERRLADWRAQGRPWAEIAAEVGGSPKALCKQLARAADRVARELGLDEA